jgi:uracil-DNA glycosylase family 4
MPAQRAGIHSRVTDERVVKLVRQAARTARLLGVDFVPAYRKSGDAAQPPEPKPVAVSSRSELACPARPDPPLAPQPVVVVDHRSLFETGHPAAGSTDRDVAMNALRARYESEAPHSKFVTAHTKIVWGEGSLHARLVFVGEAPGEEEDRQGRPFVGRSGQLLTKMIEGMGLRREDVYICNVLKTRPPNNATPTAREIELCEPYLREQIAIIDPEVIVTLGLPASRAILHTDESMTRMRGRWRGYTLPSGRVVPVMPTFHPAYILRNYTEETRRQVWSDLQQVMGKLGILPAGRVRRP